jgi:hypothetical protein
MLVAAGADLIGDVADLERMGVHALLGDEGADTGDAHQHAIRGELAQRPIGRHAGDGERTRQLVLRGHAGAGRQPPSGDLLEDEMLHLQVARGRSLDRHEVLR